MYCTRTSSPLYVVNEGKGKERKGDGTGRANHLGKYNEVSIPSMQDKTCTPTILTPHVFFQAEVGGETILHWYR